MLILEVTDLPLKFHLDSLRFERGFCVCIFEAPLVSSSCCLGLFLRRSLLEREGLRRARRLQSEAAPDARARLTRQAADGARRSSARGSSRRRQAEQQPAPAAGARVPGAARRLVAQPSRPAAHAPALGTRPAHKPGGRRRSPSQEQVHRPVEQASVASPGTHDPVRHSSTVSKFLSSLIFFTRTYLCPLVSCLG